MRRVDHQSNRTCLYRRSDRGPVLKQATLSLPGESVSRGFADRGALEGYPSHYTSLVHLTRELPLSPSHDWPRPRGLATPAGWSNQLARESCLSDKHHIRSPRFQCAFLTRIRMSANSVVHCQITKISICIFNYLSNADAQHGSPQS